MFFLHKRLDLSSKTKQSFRVQFSRSVMSDSLWPHEMQHARPPCPSPTPRVHSNSCPSSRWCHPASSSAVLPFSSCPQPLPASGSFPMNQLVAWGGQSIGVSASASVLPIYTQDWSPLGWTGWIFLQSFRVVSTIKKVVVFRPPHPDRFIFIIWKFSCTYCWVHWGLLLLLLSCFSCVRLCATP